MKNRYIWWLLAFTGLFIVLFVLSMMLGYKHFSFVNVWKHLILGQEIKDQRILTQLRLPRAVLGGVVGVLMGISGVMIQTITRNPFASPGIMGVNSGASLMVVIMLIGFGINGSFQLAFMAFLGTIIVATMIILATSLPLRPFTAMELTLFGASISAFCMAVTQGLLVYNESAIEEIISWLNGSVANKHLNVLMYIWPFIVVGLIISMYMARQLNLYILSEDALKGLGAKILSIKVITMIAVVLLSGSAVALAGPIAFVGLITPHVAKLLCRTHNHFIIIPMSGLLGGCLLMLSDILSRYLLMPREIPVGITTALLGTPVFIYLILKRKELTE
ncbi:MULTISPECIES: FecCD family ABC transporter permease [Staphylococcus]|uniref:Probable heme-iron transport system permease protein IsdF n=2 Tax=Staphylococcus TaxID=1279 RepID=A0A9Q4H0G7_9STAP|nr:MULTISPECIES: iron ABC transporter permease [Staphylococcus]ASE37268.1 iron ABC transporter permease [Staphylococcus pettenkoferi]EHM70507.1 iron chelate uptake ABC transporter, FeCT family, permease protein [Staphylococcus pettenkoferi VCU012]MBX8993143.1 iron ABC transporter permease [Staphylococcus pettenkoferi]MCY1563562.1 iron ABC transporter permease [Staphylococcus pettenkoferi]MCY1567294.1 iron ABC transporter permease [Staphylococcus pettenkoferi]